MSQEPDLQPSRRRALLDLWLSKSGVLPNVGGLWSAEGVKLIAGVVQMIFVARWLGPRMYGLAAVITGYSSAVAYVFNAQSWDVTVKYLGQFLTAGEQHKAYAMTKLSFVADALLAGAALGLVVVTASWADGRVVHVDGTAYLLILHAAAFVVGSPLNTSWSVLASQGSFRLLAVLQSAASVTRAGLILGFVAMGLGFRGFVFGSSLAIALEGILLGSIAYRAASVSWRDPRQGHFWSDLKGHRREILGRLAWSDFGGLVKLAANLDVVILGYFRGPREVGFLRAARSLSGFGLMVVGPLQSVVFPQLVRIWGEADKRNMRRTISRYAIGVGVPLASLALLCTFLVPFVIRTFVGSAFAPAIPVAQVLVAAAAVGIAFFWMRPAYMAVGSVRRWALLLSATGVLSLAGYALTAERFGAIGIAWVSFAVAGVGLNGLALILLRRSPIWRTEKDPGPLPLEAEHR